MSGGSKYMALLAAPRKLDISFHRLKQPKCFQHTVKFSDPAQLLLSLPASNFETARDPYCRSYQRLDKVRPSTPAALGSGSCG